ncbi:CYTH domain-containing protein [Halalkalibacter akibai]|uniref:Adenylate cyclase n=1 Tax=Halalkalibacter akibai (strain ATCC 43226 / DSM 21942 / CIP 109018 / JCM 9157 / 1139) TaxID=1236973 RepID=W4QZG9_HALA3|nr:CYTH domain-containing protein [Halalkalibacter akibai]GAE37063.1 adenylate cyclase [Halalkalibacter akibai JCM 9157]
MSQEIEIEVKSMITKENYHELLKGFNLTEADAIVQHNHYFETPSFSLKATGSGLRIREKKGIFTLTLKQPHEVGKLETHQVVSHDEWLNAKDNCILPDGKVMNQLRNLKIPTDQLQFVGTLTTKRIEINYEEGQLCFDQSSYFDQIDYEIEFEGKTEHHAKSTLLQLLSSYGLEQTPTHNKVRRFFNTKYKKQA